MRELVPFIAMSLMAGALIPLQAVVNARLAQALGSGVGSALVSFAVGTLALLAVALIVRAPLPKADGLAGTPLWIWTGGFLGAYFVFNSLVSVQKLGAAGMIAAIIVAQLAVAAALDHFGALHGAAHPMTLARAAGLALLVAGAALTLRG